MHILASLTDDGRAGIVCPQGVLFRGQPEVEEETGAVDSRDNAKIRRRKADDEHLIRRALLDSRLIEAVISLPLNVFYGAGVPACLLILRKQRPAERQDQVLLIYAARHYRELSAQNELRPQDVMRILVHYHAYGDATKVPGLAAGHMDRIHKEIDRREEDEVGRIGAEYQSHAGRLATVEAKLREARSQERVAETKREKAKAAGVLTQIMKQRDKVAAKVAERDERIAEARRSAQDDRNDVTAVGEELVALYAAADELLKHARVVEIGEVSENEFNLNVPRYVDTFEVEPRLEVRSALNAVREAVAMTRRAEVELSLLMEQIGYDV